VHATYTFDGSTGAAKRLRFAEVGLWDPAADAAAAAAEAGTPGGGVVGVGGVSGGGAREVSRGGGGGGGGGKDAAREKVVAVGEAPKVLTFDPAPAVAGLGDQASIGAHLEAEAYTRPLFSSS
jgi:hypothetical protein